MNQTFQAILQQTKAVKCGDQWIGHCPAHDDTSPSLAIKNAEDKILLKCYKGCSFNAITEALNVSSKDLSANPNPYEPITLDQLAQHKGFTIDYLKSIGVKQRSKGIEISYYLPDGSLAPRQRLRRKLSGTKGSFWFDGPGKPVPYGLNRLSEARQKNYLILVEGESDCWSLWFHGFPALGIPGAAMTNKLEAHHLVNIETIYVHHEPDAGGDTFVKGVKERLRKIGWTGTVLEFHLHPHKDPSELHLAERQQFVSMLQSALKTSKPIQSPTDKPKSQIMCMADVKTEEVQWIWKHRIANGKLTMLVGDPGLGKSFLTCYMASVLSQGRQWPDGTYAPKGKTLMVSVEDDPSDTIAPRLNGMKADVSQVFTQKVSQFDLSLLLPEIEKHVIELQDVRLVIIDPITALLGGRDGNSNSDIRGLLAPISEMAQRLQTAVLVVSHLNKSNQDKAIYRASGSLAFTAAARTVWLLSQHPIEKTKRILYPIKNNLAANTGGLCFTLEGEPFPDLVWDDGVYEFAEKELLSNFKPNKTDSTLTEAEDFLLETLEPGPLPPHVIFQAAQDKGFSERTLRRAKKSLGIKSERMGFGENAHYVWSLS